MRELLTGAGNLTADQKTRSWRAVHAAIDAGPRQNRRIRIIAAGVVAAALAGGTAAVIVAAQPITDLTIAECRSQAGGSSVAGTEVQIATRTGEPGTITDAVSDCAAFWRAGLLHLGEPGIHHPPGWDGELDGPHPVPPLTGCTRDDGAAVVVVGEGAQACVNAGYAPTTNP